MKKYILKFEVAANSSQELANLIREIIDTTSMIPTEVKNIESGLSVKSKTPPEEDDIITQTIRKLP